MPDTQRRSALSSRAKAIRVAAETLIESVVDQDVKDLMRRLVIFPLDDVQNFFLVDPSVHPSSADYESRWLDHAGLLLRGAEDQFQELQITIKAVGGPEKVRTIG